MTILAMPSGCVRGARFMLRPNTQTFVSPLSRSVQTLQLTGDRWEAQFDLIPMKRETAAAWQAFLARLGGMAGRFYAGDPGAKSPRGLAGGAPKIKGAAQTGTSLITDGWIDQSRWITGRLNGGLRSETTPSRYAEAANSASLNITGSTMTIEAWVRRSRDWKAARFLDKADQYGVGIDAAGHWQAYFCVVPGGGGYTWVDSAFAAPIAVWTHIAVSYDGTNVRFYVNGALKATIAHPVGGAIGAETTVLRFGNQHGAAAWNELDDVRIWNDVRSGPEILANYYTELTGAEGNLVAYWKINEAAGNACLDATANDNDALIKGAVTGLLLPGDYISFDTPTPWREMHMVVAQADSNLAGEATLTIAPPIRESPADNADITINSPTCVMMLASDEQGAWDLRPGRIYEMTFEALEAFA